jgi:hypothetical protein
VFYAGNISWSSENDCPVVGYLEGYYRPDESGQYTLRVEGENVGVRLQMQYKALAGGNAFFHQPYLKLQSTVHLDAGRPYHFVAYMMSYVIGADIAWLLLNVDYARQNDGTSPKSVIPGQAPTSRPF